MICPPYLKPGDQVRIVSTARKITEEELQPAVQLLKSWGLQIQSNPYLFEQDHQFAGDVDTRAKALQEALDDLECKAIICARGGYGTAQIIDQIDFSGFKSNPKWLVGYSDVTVLHNHVQQVLAVESLHATMPINFPKDGRENNATASLKTALFGGQLQYEIQPHVLNTHSDFEIEGHLLGGNLSILYSLTGTHSQIDAKGAILFMEDLDEYLYHIDRIMMNLKRAGLFDECKGVLVGGMSDMNDNTVPFGETAEEIIVRNLRKYNVPVIFGFPAGHIEDNRALIMGRHLKISTSGEKINCVFNG